MVVLCTHTYSKKIDSGPSDFFLGRPSTLFFLFWVASFKTPPDDGKGSHNGTTHGATHGTMNTRIRVSKTTHRYDYNRGVLRGTVVFGTNLAGGSGDSFNRGSGKFGYSGLGGQMWSVGTHEDDGVIRSLAEDFVNGCMPPLSSYHRPRCVFPGKADFDAQAETLYTDTQLKNLGNLCLESYKMCCPDHWVNDEARTDDPVAILSFQSETKVTRTLYCKCGEVFNQESPNCSRCGEPIDIDALTEKIAYKNGFHFHMIQRRSEDGETFDVNRSGPVLTTAQHLAVRDVILILWEKRSAESPADYPPFSAGDELDPAPLGSENGDWNGCLRPDGAPKVCACACEAHEDITECIFCGSSKKDGTRYKIIEHGRRYVPRYVLTAGGGMHEALSVTYANFDCFRGKIHSMQDVDMQEVPVRVNGRLLISVCSRGWMYFPKGVRVGDSVETMDGDAVVVEDDRISRVVEIMRASSGWVPDGTEATPFEVPENYAVMVRNKREIIASVGVGVTQVDRKPVSTMINGKRKVRVCVAKPTREERGFRCMSRERGTRVSACLKKILIQVYGARNRYNEHTQLQVKWNPSSSRSPNRCEMIIANIKGHGAGFCTNAVFCSCSGTKKLRENYPWTVEGRPVTVGRSDVKTQSVCSKCRGLPYGRHSSNTQYLCVYVDDAKQPPVARMRLMCHSTQIGFSGYCCSEKAHAKSSVGGEWRLPQVRFGMEWKRVKDEDARILFPDAFASLPEDGPILQISTKNIVPSAAASGKVLPSQYKRKQKEMLAPRQKKRNKGGGLLAKIHK